jgi:hypothetical protein
LTSNSVPSLNVHFTISVSGEAPWTGSLLDRALQKEGKLWSFMRCQTWLKGAEMTADSVTEVEVGMRDAILEEVCFVDLCFEVKVCGLEWMEVVV